MVSVYSQLIKQAEKLCGDVISQPSWFDRYAESQRADVYSWRNWYNSRGVIMQSKTLHLSLSNQSTLIKMF